MPWFRKKDQKIESVPAEERVVKTEGIFVKCDECDAALFKPDLDESLQVCSHCGYHFRIGARERLEMLFDEGKYEELDADVISVDPLNFVDTKPYPERLEQARRITGLPEAIINGRGTVGGHLVLAGAMDMLFIGGSMGSAVGDYAPDSCGAEGARRTRHLRGIGRRANAGRHVQFDADGEDFLCARRTR